WGGPPGTRPARARPRGGLADPRLAGDQHDLPFALPGEALAFQQEVEIVLAADEIGQTCHADRLEAAFGIGCALDRPCRDRLGDTLELVRAAVAQTEQITTQPAVRGADGDCPEPR